MTRWWLRGFSALLCRFYVYIWILYIRTCFLRFSSNKIMELWLYLIILILILFIYLKFQLLFMSYWSVDDRKKFQEAAKKGNLVPLYQCIFSDQLTPILAYRCLVKEDDREAPSFLCESVEPSFRDSSVVSFCSFGISFFLSFDLYLSVNFVFWFNAFVLGAF